MDEACGGVPETITRSDIMTTEEDEKSKPTDDASGRECEKLLEDQLRNLRFKFLDGQKLQSSVNTSVDDLIKELRGHNRNLETEVTSWKAKNNQLENEMKRLEGLKKIKREEFALAQENAEDYSIMYAALKSSYEAWKSSRALHKQPTERLNSWRGIVGEIPDFSWNLEKFSYKQIYKEEFDVTEYGMRCKGQLRPALLNLKPAFPALKLFAPFHPDEARDSRGKPMVMLTIRGKDRLQVEKSKVERLHARFSTADGYFYEGIVGFPTEQRCVSLTVDVWFELPWSVREVQSEHGVLFWTVEDLFDVLEFDGSVLCSPYFLINGADSYRLQAVLSVATGDSLHLRVIRLCPFAPNANISDYVVSVTVLKPEHYPDKMTTFARSTDFKNEEDFVLGKAHDLTVNNIFSCRVKVLKQKL